MVVGADASLTNLAGGHTSLGKLVSIDTGQVQMPFVVLHSGVAEVEAGLGKLVVDFLTHFEAGH